jgi:hypothetical protein
MEQAINHIYKKHIHTHIYIHTYIHTHTYIHNNFIGAQILSYNSRT